MRENPNPNVWEFDTDNTLVLWNLSDHPDEPKHWFHHTGKGPVQLVVNKPMVHLLVECAKAGWFIRVYSGSGMEWAKAIVEQLGIDHYVDEVAWKPRGRSDDRPPGDGLAYNVYKKI